MTSREDFYTDSWRFQATPDEAPQWMTRVYPPMWGSRQNRTHGRDWYQFRNELDLLLQRDAVRSLVATNPIALGLVEDIGSFVVGTGYTPTVAPPREMEGSPRAKDLAKLTQRYLEDWAEAAPDAEDLTDSGYTEEPGWRGDLEGELFEQSLIDGECYGVPVYDAGRGLLMRRCESEFITPPTGEDPQQSEWSWGHLNAVNADGTHDVAKILAYNYRDPNTLAEKVYPANRMVHYKRNVTSSTKRGVSDFLPVVDDLQRVDSLANALLLGSKLRASIAFIERIEGGARNASADVANKLATRISTDPMTGGLRYERNIRPGTVQTSNGVVEVKTMPQGNTTESIAAAEFAMRYFARRFGVPENMISGNVGNFNYATMLAAGNPFVVRILRAQIRYGSKVVLPVYVHAICAGVYAGHLPWDALACRVSAVGPNPVMANKLEEAQIRQLNLQARVTSPQAEMQAIGSDPQKTVQDWKEWEEEFPAQTTPPQLDLNGVFDREPATADADAADAQAS